MKNQRNQKQKKKSPEDKNKLSAECYQPIIADAVNRVNEKERKAVARQNKKESTPEESKQWAEKFFESQEDYLTEAILPAFLSASVPMSHSFVCTIEKIYKEKADAFINGEHKDAIDDDLINIILEEL